MQTASELLTRAPVAPLSAILFARPVRACVFVPAVEGVSWQRLVEHALAAQGRIWGGAHNFVVPTGWDLSNDRLFLRLVDLFDPDVVALHLPTYADAREVASESYEEAIANTDRQLRDLGFDEQARATHIQRLNDELFVHVELPAEVRAGLAERVAPLLEDDEQPRSVYIDGTRPPSYPLTDVGALRELPETIVDVTSTLGDVDRLMLTHAVGRLLPSFKAALEERGVGMNPVEIGNQTVLLKHVWTSGRVEVDFAYPRAFAETGLARRRSFPERDRVVVVVGDEPRDFLLYHGLSRLRAYVYWLPAEWLGSDAVLQALAHQIWLAARTGIGADDVAVTTASSADETEAAVDALNGIPGRGQPEAHLAEWEDVVPTSRLWAVDARSERRVSLLRHEGETQELPTPPPASVSADDFTELRWMVDVEVQGWEPARHSSLGPHVLRGPLVTRHGARTSAIGPSFFGLTPFVQPFLGLEGSTARPRLRPRAIAEQVSDILAPSGWEVSLSDKGAYALESARLFGGFEALASALRSQPTRTLLDAYLTDSRRNDPGIFLSDTGRRYLSLREAAPLIEGADVPSLVADLYDHAVLVRGHVLKCEYCRATSFYSLDEEQRFTCVRCRTDQRATRFSWLSEPEPEFRYALNEVLFQFLRNNGQLPLLAANDHFGSGRNGRERAPFDIAFEVELTSPDGQRREHDILATWGTELWIGEATVGDRLEDGNADELGRLNRLAETAHSLSARGVLLVTTRDRFSERTRGNVGTVFTDPLWPEVIYVEGFDAGHTVAE